jgi:hypothetical protein
MLLEFNMEFVKLYSDQEMADKFFLPSIILEAKSFNEELQKGNFNPFEQKEIIVTSRYKKYFTAVLVSLRGISDGLVDTGNPPLRLFLGKQAYPLIKRFYDARFAEWDKWNDISVAAHGH